MRLILGIRMVSLAKCLRNKRFLASVGMDVRSGRAGYFRPAEEDF